MGSIGSIGNREIRYVFWWKNLKERAHLKELEYDGRILLKWFLKNRLGKRDQIFEIDSEAWSHKIYLTIFVFLVATSLVPQLTTLRLKMEYTISNKYMEGIVT